MPPAPADSFFVYILQCADNTFYIGRATDLAERIIRHNEGRGALWTSRRRPVKLVYSEAFPSDLEATRRELQLKRWTHAKKTCVS
jgi:putative endonuclease